MAFAHCPRPARALAFPDVALRERRHLRRRTGEAAAGAHRATTIGEAHRLRVAHLEVGDADAAVGQLDAAAAQHRAWLEGDGLRVQEEADTADGDVDDAGVE